jgi:hypothetical protein
MESKPLLLPTAVRSVPLKRALQLINGFLHQQHESNYDSSKCMLNRDKIAATVPDDVIEKLTTIKTYLDRERSYELIKSSTGKRTISGSSSSGGGSSSSSSSNAHVSSTQQSGEGSSKKKSKKEKKSVAPVTEEEVELVPAINEKKKSKSAAKATADVAQTVDGSSEGTKRKKKKESLN